MDLNKIGMTEDELFDILSEAISPGRIASSEETKRIITKVIVANNEKILKDLKGAQKKLWDGLDMQIRMNKQ